MAVNDIFTLPLRMRNIDQLSDLLATEQIEIDNLYNTIKENENQLFINSSSNAISRYENLFDLPSNDDYSIDERRSKIIAKLNTRSPATVKALEETSRLITKNQCDITERYSEYAFIINIDRTNLIIFDMLILISNIDVLKPAHLVYTIAFNCKSKIGCSIGTMAYKINYDLQGCGYSGEIPYISTIGAISSNCFLKEITLSTNCFTSPYSGVYPDIAVIGRIHKQEVESDTKSSFTVNQYDLCNENDVAGQIPNINLQGKLQTDEVLPEITFEKYVCINELCGTDYCGEGG